MRCTYAHTSMPRKNKSLEKNEESRNFLSLSLSPLFTKPSAFPRAIHLSHYIYIPSSFPPILLARAQHNRDAHTYKRRGGFHGPGFKDKAWRENLEIQAPVWYIIRVSSSCARGRPERTLLVRPSSFRIRAILVPGTALCKLRVVFLLYSRARIFPVELLLLLLHRLVYYALGEFRYSMGLFKAPRCTAACCGISSRRAYCDWRSFFSLVSFENFVLYVCSLYLSAYYPRRLISAEVRIYIYLISKFRGGSAAVLAKCPDGVL